MLGTPMDLRVRRAIVRARAQGLSYDAVAALLGVGRATVSRVLRLQRETGDVEPRPRGGGNFSLIHGAIETLLRSLVETRADATVAELAAELCARAQIDVSRSSVQRALNRLGYSRKKRRSLRLNGMTPNDFATTGNSADA